MYSWKGGIYEHCTYGYGRLNQDFQDALPNMQFVLSPTLLSCCLLPSRVLHGLMLWLCHAGRLLIQMKWRRMGTMCRAPIDVALMISITTYSKKSCPMFDQ